MLTGFVFMGLGDSGIDLTPVGRAVVIGPDGLFRLIPWIPPDLQAILQALRAIYRGFDKLWRRQGFRGEKYLTWDVIITGG